MIRSEPSGGHMHYDVMDFTVKVIEYDRTE